MKKNILIVEDEKGLTELYKRLFKEYNLTIFNNLQDTLDFVNSSSFDKINLAIIDVNLGDGLEISGFHIVYHIQKIKPYLPIIICTAYEDDFLVKSYAQGLDLQIIRKPFSPNIKELISEKINRKHRIPVDEIEQLTRVFMSSALYLKFVLQMNFEVSEEINAKINVLEKVEVRINKAFNEITSKLSENPKEYINVLQSTNTGYKFYKSFKQDLEFYITNMLRISQKIILSQINASEDEIELVEELDSIGEKLLKELKD